MDGARASLPNSEVSLADYAATNGAGALRRDSLGRDVAPVIWRALDRAVETTVDVLAERNADSETRESLAQRVVAAAAMVRRLTRRTEEPPRASFAPVTARVVETLRCELLRELQMEASRIDGRHLVRVLLAFETLAGAMARAADARAESVSASPGIDGLVEIAHDMRSPLGSILFLVDAIRSGRSGPVSPVQERQLGLIYGAALGLSSLATDLIDLVRGGDRLVDGPPVPFSVAEVMLHVRDIVTPIAEEKGLALDFKLPKVDGRVGYAGALGRVLLNLTTNALKYTDRGSVKIGCSEVSASRVVFWVADTGRGIPEPVRRVLFSPFRRTAGRMRFSNTGLGLAICRSLLGAMDSSLQVESSESAGTWFSFELELPAA